MGIQTRRQSSRSEAVHGAAAKWVSIVTGSCPTGASNDDEVHYCYEIIATAPFNRCFLFPSKRQPQTSGEVHLLADIHNAEATVDKTTTDRICRPVAIRAESDFEAQIPELTAGTKNGGNCLRETETCE